MSFTYDQLKTAIQDYTQNQETSFVTNLPVFIRSAEERILKTVQLSLFRKNVTGNMTVNDEFLIMPTDFLAPFSLSFTDSNNEKKFLDFKSVNFIHHTFPDDNKKINRRIKRFLDLLSGDDEIIFLRKAHSEHHHNESNLIKNDNTPNFVKNV